MNRTALVTGAAGFIGYHVASRLLDDGWCVVGVDNINDYYDPRLKKARLAALAARDAFTFRYLDIADDGARDAVASVGASVIIHLAAQAGVRHSVGHPDVYVRTNVVGMLQVLEACRRSPVSHLVYASSSSVYGKRAEGPSRESDPTDRPLSLYAATKKSTELMAHSYSALHGIPATGLRFFTVYGPFGRPDMAYYLFADAWASGRPIMVFGAEENEVSRDFTYIDDIVEGLVRVVDSPPAGPVPHRVLNIGHGSPVSVTRFIGELEVALEAASGRDVTLERLPAPLAPGDVHSTWAATDALEEAIGFVPSTPLALGLRRFADWYVSFNAMASEPREDSTLSPRPTAAP